MVVEAGVAQLGPPGIGQVRLRHAAPVGTRDVHPVQLHLGAVPPGDLADLGDGAAALAVAAEVDEEVDGVGDQQRGDRELHGLGALGDVLGELLPRRQRRVMVHGRQAGMAVLHGEQHLPGGVAVAHLADDQPARVEAQGVADELALGDLTDALDVGLARLPFEDGSRPAWIGGEVELAGVLDDDHPGLRRQLVGHRAQQRRLAGAGLARHDDAHPGDHRRRQQRAHPPVDGAALLELVEGGVGQHVAADRHLRHLGDVHDRGEPRSVGQAQDEQRLGIVEAAFRATRPAGEVGDLGAQVVGVGEHATVMALDEPVDALQPDRVVGVDHDVGDAVEVEQGLELAGVEVGGDRPADQLPFRRHVHRSLAGLDGATSPAGDVPGRRVVGEGLAFELVPSLPSTVSLSADECLLHGLDDLLEGDVAHAHWCTIESFTVFPGCAATGHQ